MESRLFDTEIANARVVYNDLEIQFITIDYDAKRPIWYTPNHSHDYYEFYMLLDGKQYTVVEGVQFVTSAGEFILVPPNIEHGHRQFGTLQDSGILVRFNLARRPGIQRAAGTADRVIDTLRRQRHRPFRDAELARLFTDVPRDADLDQLTLRMTGFVLRLAAILRRDVSEPGKAVSRRNSENNNELILRVVMTIMTSYMTELSLDSLAEFHGISKRNLSRQFTRATGFTVMRFVLLERMQSALRLLQSGDLHIREIAFRVGFHSEFYFSNSFSRLFGAPPTAYRIPGKPIPDEMARFQRYIMAFERHIAPQKAAVQPEGPRDIPMGRFVQYVSGSAINLIQDSTGTNAGAPRGGSGGYPSGK